MSESLRPTRVVRDLGEWRGGSTPAKAASAFWRPGTIPWVTPKDMAVAEIRGSQDYVSPLGAARLTVFKPGTVAVVFRSGILRHTLPVARGAVPFTVNQDIKVLTTAEDVDCGFAYHSLLGIAKKVVASAVKSGTTVESVDPALFFALRVFIPPLIEQQKIAEVLDTLDEAIRKTEAIIAKLKQVKQGLLRDLLTRGIDENGEIRDPERHPELFKDSPLGRVPRQWLITTLRSCLVENPTNGIYKPASAIGRGTLLVGQTAFTAERSVDLALARRAVVAASEVARYRIEPGDILISRVFATVEGVGRPALVPELPETAVYESNMMRLRVASDVIRPEMLFYSLMDSRVRRLLEAQVNASNQASINQKGLNVLPVACPPLVEQKLIVSITAGADGRRRAEERELAKLRLLKQGLMEDLLTGRVRVTPLLAEPTP
jgi:type I restriction enzyme S subunit